MGNMLLVLVVAGCLPSLAYLCYHVFQKFKVRLGCFVPGEGLTQLVLATIAIFCFGTGLVLVVLPFTSHIPYYKQEKGMIVALLFLLMGILAFQVMQFIRTQVRPSDPRRDNHYGGRRRSPGRAKRTVTGSYAVSNSKN
jgi:hypothetical protein